MAKKKPGRKTSKAASNTANGQERGNKSKAIRAYLASHKGAMPKEVVPALKAQGIDVSPNMVSMVKAKAKIKRSRRRAKEATASQDATAGAKRKNSAALDAALTLFKAARGQEVAPPKVRQAFLLLVEELG